jgi:serine/threonine protein kinase
MLDMAKVEIIEELGRGSFGTVSLAKYSGQAVAVKKLLASPADHLSLFQGFRRELWIGRWASPLIPLYLPFLLLD